MKHRIVSRMTQGAFRYQAWPTVCRGEDGTLYLGTSGHRLDHICPFGKDLMYVSYDDGDTWSAPQIINDTWLDDRDAGMLAWGEGNLHLTWFNHAPDAFKKWDPYVDTRPHYAVGNPLSLGMRKMWESLPKEELGVGSFTKISRDNGKTWSEPRPAPVTSPHGPCLLQDGSLFWLGTLNTAAHDVSIPKANEIQDMDGGGGNLGNSIYAFRSTDDGATWEYVSHAPCPKGADKYCCEPHAIQLKDGTVLGVVRYHYDKGHGNRKMYFFSSKDCGKTWSEAEFIDGWGCPPHLLEHSSGAIILVYGKRCEVMGQYVRISRDGGKTWSGETLISPEAPDWDQGYPSSVELTGGDVLTVYYQKCPGDKFNSLHSVRWSLDELDP